MMTLPIGFTAVTWTGADTPIASLADVAGISRVFAANPVTGIGYVGYQRGGLYPTLSTLRTGVSYLIDAALSFTLADAVGAPMAFASFPGYTAPTASAPATPVAPANVVVSATAAADIIVGRLVGRVPAGVVPYDATDLDHRQRLLGIALNSAVAGTNVNVQQRGTVLIPGLGLGQAGDVLHARGDGQMGVSSDGMAFQHIVGRTLTPDSFFLTSQSTYSL